MPTVGFTGWLWKTVRSLKQSTSISAAAAVWLAVLSGKPVTKGIFPGADLSLLTLIQKTVNQIVRKDDEK